MAIHHGEAIEEEGTEVEPFQDFVGIAGVEVAASVEGEVDVAPKGEDRVDRVDAAPIAGEVGEDRVDRVDAAPKVGEDGAKTPIQCSVSEFFSAPESFNL